MSQIGMTITGLNETIRGLNRMSREMPRVADRVMGDWARQTRLVLRNRWYPPKPPGSQYKRKGAAGGLPSRYYAQKIRQGLWMIGNSADYASFVVGDHRGQGQTFVHTQRWYLFSRVVEQRVPELERRLDAEYQRLAP